LTVLDAVATTLATGQVATDVPAFESQLAAAASGLAAAQRRMAAEKLQGRLAEACSNLEAATAACTVAFDQFRFEDAGSHVEQSRKELEGLEEHRDRAILKAYRVVPAVLAPMGSSRAPM
jgi:hypothetical protein